MKKRNIIIFAALFVLAAAIGAVFALRALEMKNAPDPLITAEEYIDGVLSDEGEGKICRITVCEVCGEYEMSYRRAAIKGSAQYIDREKLSEGIGQDMNARLAQLVDEAKYAGDIYNEDKSFREDTLRQAFDEVLTERLGDEKYRSIGEVSMELSYDGKAWSVESFNSPLDGQDEEETEQMLYSAATAELSYIKKTYRIAQDAVAGPVPEQKFFGSTDDPAVIEELLASDTAQELMNGQTTAWNRNLDFIPGRLMRYYMDETILVLQWQEVTARAVGTFSEVFVADGSQIRRKLAGDKPFSYEFDYPTDLARQANAVLAVGGDLYNHGRACGIVVYQSGIYRFEPVTCDTCYITADGSMIYSKAGEFTEQAQAESFIKENDVLFSLCFGPVLIENGQDMTPQSYAWGEINDTYARSALGMLGQRHYLTMNINCEWNDYYYLATLKQATEAMLTHGCVSAYALDGGQTASTVLNGELINVVQFNTEKLTSDMLYFATALPN